MSNAEYAQFCFIIRLSSYKLLTIQSSSYPYNSPNFSMPSSQSSSTVKRLTPLFLSSTVKRLTSPRLFLSSSTRGVIPRLSSSLKGESHGSLFFLSSSDSGESHGSRFSVSDSGTMPRLWNSGVRTGTKGLVVYHVRSCFWILRLAGSVSNYLLGAVGSATVLVMMVANIMEESFIMKRSLAMVKIDRASDIIPLQNL